MSFEFRNGRAAVVGRSASTAPFPSEILTGHLCDDSVGRVLLDPPPSLPPCREGTRFSRGLRERERERKGTRLARGSDSRREIHPKLSKNVGAINSCRSSAVSLAGSSSSRRRRASRQTSFKCALKFHQVATSRKPSRRLYQVRLLLLLSYLAGPSTRRVPAMGSASGSFLPHHRPSFYGLRTILIQIPDSTLPPFLFFFSSPPVYLALLFLFFFLHSSLELLNSFSYFVSSPCSIRMDVYRHFIGSISVEDRRRKIVEISRDSLSRNGGIATKLFDGAD